jgi:hypothetical protein
MTATRCNQGVSATGTMLLLAALLTACGGGGGGSGGGGSAPGGGDGGGGELPRTLSKLPAAKFSDEETVALLAPGSAFGDTVGLTLSGLAFFGEVGGVADSRVLQTQACGDAGRIEFLFRRDEAVQSPYNGGLFDMVATDDQNCQEGDLNNTTSFAQTTTDGERRIAYPVSGEGSGDPGSAQVFVGYERSGTGLDDPFHVSLQTESGGFEWSRYWDGHIRVERGSAADSRLGDGGGDTRLYQVSRQRTGGIGYDLQTGSGADDRFQLQFQAIDERSASRYREENYQGVYGRRMLNASGEPLGGECPAGRFQVETSQPLIVDIPDDDDSELFLFGDSQYIVSGGLAMEDDAGNTAQVVYDGVAGTVSVTLNGGSAQVFDYQTLSEAWRTRCSPAP